jgi:Golgi nucleoside diphosphatase
LLEFALSHIPVSQHPHTVLYIFGTAGMRLLPAGDQTRIMEALYEKVSLEYPFHLPKDGVQVISGKLEGRDDARTNAYHRVQLCPFNKVFPLIGTPSWTE